MPKKVNHNTVSAIAAAISLLQSELNTIEYDNLKKEYLAVINQLEMALAEIAAEN